MYHNQQNYHPLFLFAQEPEFTQIIYNTLSCKLRYLFNCCLAPLAFTHYLLVSHVQGVQEIDKQAGKFPCQEEEGQVYNSDVVRHVRTRLIFALLRATLVAQRDLRGKKGGNQVRDSPIRSLLQPHPCPDCEVDV